MPNRILMFGAFDVKGEEYNYLKKLIEEDGNEIIAMDFGTYPDAGLFKVDFTNDQVAAAGGGDLKKLQEEKDRGNAMKVMSLGGYRFCLKSCMRKPDSTGSIDLDCHINDEAFSDAAVDKILDLMATGCDELSERFP